MINALGIADCCPRSTALLFCRQSWAGKEDLAVGDDLLIADERRLGGEHLVVLQSLRLPLLLHIACRATPDLALQLLGNVIGSHVGTSASADREPRHPMLSHQSLEFCCLLVVHSLSGAGESCVRHCAIHLLQFLHVIAVDESTSRPCIQAPGSLQARYHTRLM